MVILCGILIMLAVIAAIAGLCLLVIWWDRNHPPKNYDERQSMERGKAYRLSTWVGLIYFLVVMVLQINEIRVEPYLLTAAGVMLMLTAFMVYGFLTNSYLTLTQRPLGTAVCFLLLGAMQVFNFVLRNDLDPLSFTGHGAFGWVMLMLAVVYFTTGTGYLILALRREKV